MMFISSFFCVKSRSIEWIECKLFMTQMLVSIWVGKLKETQKTRFVYHLTTWAANVCHQIWVKCATQNFRINERIKQNNAKLSLFYWIWSNLLLSAYTLTLAKCSIQHALWNLDKFSIPHQQPVSHC